MDYAAKTRTLISYISTVLAAFAPLHLRAISQVNRQAHRVASSGPFFDFTYLDRFAKCIQTSLTPGQVPETVQAVLKDLRSAFDDFKEQSAAAVADSGVGARKKRKTNSPRKSAGDVDDEISAISFSLVCRTAAVVLSSLPMHLLLEDAQQEIQSLISDSHSVVVVGALKDALDALEQGGRNDTWAVQLVAATALRFHYLLSSARNLRLQSQEIETGPIFERMLKACSTEETIPELAMEIVS